MVEGTEKVNNFSQYVFYKQQPVWKGWSCPQSWQVLHKPSLWPAPHLLDSSHSFIWACSGRRVHRASVINTMTFRDTTDMFTRQQDGFKRKIQNCTNTINRIYVWIPVISSSCPKFPGHEHRRAWRTGGPAHHPHLTPPSFPSHLSTDWRARLSDKNLSTRPFSSQLDAGFKSLLLHRVTQLAWAQCNIIHSESIMRKARPLNNLFF